MKLFIEPNDVLMFRDGRPFAGGDDFFARGTFPPSPATIYGALRSHVLSTNWSEFNEFGKAEGQIPDNIKKEIGTPNKLGALSLSQFTLAKRNSNCIEQFYTMPKDVVKEKGTDEDKIFTLAPTNITGSKTITDLPAGLYNVWHRSEKPMESVSGFLSSKGMGEYLSGESPTVWDAPDKLYKSEERTGIRKSRETRSVKTSGLYSVEYFRLNKNTGFAVEVENTELLPSSGILRLGGDSRSARYSTEAWQDIPIDTIKTKVAGNKLFKLVLTTPAIFKQGWLPGWITADTMQGQINGIKVKLISACVGKPIGIGGYDFVKNMPKDMKKAVPAGSVYYFVLVGDVNSLFKNVWLKSISDEKSQEGFGITLIGGFDYV